MRRRLVCIVTLIAVMVTILAGWNAASNAGKPPRKQSTRRPHIITLVPVYTPASYALVPTPAQLKRGLKKAHTVRLGQQTLNTTVDVQRIMRPTNATAANHCTDAATAETKMTAFLIDATDAQHPVIVDAKCQDDGGQAQITFSFTVTSGHAYYTRVCNSLLGAAKYNINGHLLNAGDNEAPYEGIDL